MREYDVSHTELSMPQTRQKAGRKERLTLSLERGTVRFLKSCAKAKASSVSACVEQIIATSRQTSETERLNAQILAYYESLSEQERREEAAWGEFAESEWAKVES
jgi:hypothetical protein